MTTEPLSAVGRTSVGGEICVTRNANASAADAPFTPAELAKRMRATTEGDQLRATLKRIMDASPTTYSAVCDFFRSTY